MSTTDGRDKGLAHEQKRAAPSEEERTNGFVRPVRTSYVHTCGYATAMPRLHAEIAARYPSFYEGMFCANCKIFAAVDSFIWNDGSGEKVGT